MFDHYIGIDYSGGGTPLERRTGLQIYVATNKRLPERVNSPNKDGSRIGVRFPNVGILETGNGDRKLLQVIEVLRLLRETLPGLHEGEAGEPPEVIRRKAERAAFAPEHRAPVTA